MRPGKSYLYTTIVLCVIGSYSSHNNMFDVFTMFAAGLIGFFMQKFGFPVAPTILACWYRTDDGGFPQGAHSFLRQFRHLRG